MVAIGDDGTPIDMGRITQLLQELRIDNVKRFIARPWFCENLIFTISDF